MDLTWFKHVKHQIFGCNHEEWGFDRCWSTNGGYNGKNNMDPLQNIGIKHENM